MPGVDGYQSWSYSMLRKLYLNGVALLDSSANVPSSWSLPDTPGTILPTMDQGGIIQIQMIGGDCPVMAALTISLNMQHNIQADYERMTLAELTPPVLWWAEMWLPCAWYIPAKNTGQTTWKTNRRFPYGGAIPGVTHATHPPEVLIDGVAQTIITSGTPGAGEVLVPEAAGFVSITTPADISGEWLVLRAPFELVVKISGPNTGNPQNNLLTYAATLQEVQGAGGYTGATA